jgi:hypothetical protein
MDFFRRRGDGRREPDIIVANVEFAEKFALRTGAPATRVGLS